MSIFDGVEKGSIVRIKFKPIQDIVKNQKITGKAVLLHNYEIGDNIIALTTGGDFIVVCNENKDSKQEPFIEIDNHYDGDTFYAYAEIIDTIEVIDVANKFVSEDHGIIMIQVDDKIFINGQLLTDGESDWAEEDKNKEKQFLAFMEKYVISKAFEDSLDEES